MTDHSPQGSGSVPRHSHDSCERADARTRWGHTPSPIGVYVHFPYCLAKCPYCDFLSVAIDRASIAHDDYADAVIAELERRVSELDRATLRTVFFGGGTPSLWRPEVLGRALEAILGGFGASASGVEITVECNPSSFDESYGRELTRWGVNRVSIGVQSLDEGRLRFLGRLHDAGRGLEAVREALRAKIPRVSADLIFGVSGQSVQAAASEALTVAQLGVTHVSAYALTIEPGTRFGSLAREGRLPLADEAPVADSFVAVDEVLTSAGFEHYEVSNYAREGHVALHNLGYWRGLDYLGLGAGAWGTIRTFGERLRYRNTPSIERYLEARTNWKSVDVRTAAPGSPVAVVEPVNAATALKERIMLGLRLAEGVDVAEAAAELGTEPWPKARAHALQRLLERGRIQRHGTRLVIPREQWLFADGTIAELI